MIFNVRTSKALITWFCSGLALPEVQPTTQSGAPTVSWRAPLVRQSHVPLSLRPRGLGGRDRPASFRPRHIHMAHARDETGHNDLTGSVPVPREGRSVSPVRVEDALDAFCWAPTRESD